MYRRPGIVIFLDQGQIPSICCTDMLTPSDGVSGGYGVPADARFGSSAGCASHFMRRDNRCSLTNNHTR
ncbi:hypothetical protein ACLK1X_21580 [Escherichia coli]